LPRPLQRRLSGLGEITCQISPHRPPTGLARVGESAVRHSGNAEAKLAFVRSVPIGLSASQSIDAVILCVAAVALDPMPFDAMRLWGGHAFLPPAPWCHRRVL